MIQSMLSRTQSNENSNPSVNVIESPPPYESAGTDASNTEFTNEPPPLYTDVIKLPTYNESENIETETEEENVAANSSVFLYWLNNGLTTTQQGLNDEQLGTDLGFIFSFLVAFIFNWIGFLVAYCFTASLSSNYGAISGFGLSLVKWTFIMKHSEWSKVYFDDNPWLMYVIVLSGWMVFLRGIFAYAQLKRYVYSRRQEIDDSENGMFT